MAEFDLTESTAEGHPSLALSGDLNIVAAPDLRDALLKHVKRKGEPRVLIDLSGLEFMDTSGLATLIEAHLTAERNGGKIVLFGLRPLVAELLEVTRVTELFSICETQQDAIAALASPVD
ncbi:MAG: STAS domain-containing protein [Planctomycetota bacterium]|jgi:anti-sigma B factor antagonist